jgi:hypothetical protein
LLLEATLLHTQTVACVVPTVITLLAVASLALPGHFVAEAEDPHLVVVPPPTTHYARYATAMVTLPWTVTIGSMRPTLENSLLKLKPISLPHPAALIRTSTWILELHTI